LVIVSPSVLHDAQDERWQTFHTVKFVQTGPFESSAHAREAGVARCSAPIVAFAEDHCFPGAKWAETLIRLHGEGWAAVCPAMGNANPGAVSWADLMLNFGSWAFPAPVGTVGGTAWHNTSYRRELLCAYGGRLRWLLEPEDRLQQDLIRQGNQLYLAGDLEIKHVNVSRLKSFLHCQFWAARLYGCSRAEEGNWGVFKRLFYVAACPLIPLMRAGRVIDGANRSMRRERTFPFVVACSVGLLAGALGEVAGYALGRGAAAKIRLNYEFNRVRYLRPADRGVLP
jgi:hypothetical protein